MDLIAGRYEPVPEDAGAVRNPARDIISGSLVTVLRASAPGDALARFQEIDRLRRYAALRRPHLADVLAVDVRGGEIHVVCRALTGTVLDRGSPPPSLPVTAVRRIAAELLDAVDALHLTGVVRGWLRPDAVLLSPGPDAPTVTLLPLPLTWPATLFPINADDDRREAATLLLRLLQRLSPAGSDDGTLARELAEALERAGGTRDEPAEPHTAGPDSATEPLAALPPHVPLTLSPLSLSPLSVAQLPTVAASGDRPAALPAQRTRTAPVARTGRRPSLRTVLEASGAALALAAVIAAVIMAIALGSGAHRTQRHTAPPTARPAVTAPASASSSADPSASSSPGLSSSTSLSGWDLPTTVPALVDTLSARPDAAGRSGPALLDALRGLASADGGVQQSELRLVSLALDDPGVDTRYGAASLVALATSPLPGAPSSCFSIVPAAPDPVVQQYAQRVLDRVPAWQAQGLPADQADRLRALAGPVAAAQAAPTLAPCPAG